MDTLEISAPSLEEAKAQAAERLGVAVSRLNVTVIEETKGLFGKGQVRVKAEVKPERATKARAAKTEPVSETAAVTIEEPVEKPKRGRKPAEPEAAESEATEPKAEAKPGRKGLFGKAAEKEDAKPRAKAEPKPEPKAEAQPEPKAKPARTAKPAKDEVRAEEGDGADVVATQDDADRLSGYLDEILAASGLDAEAHVSGLNGRYVNIEVDGRDASYLVGRKGEVLNALQYLMNVVSNRRIGTGARVVLDADSYRGRREEVLTKLATDIAEQVRERGEEAVLDALPAFERRVIHKALAEMEGVTTYSEGEEPERRVVIAPAD
jgi:spoIIIJ-associated protein